MAPSTALHKALRKNSFGHRIWNQRARDSQRAKYRAGGLAEGRNRRRLFLLPPRKTKTVYRLKKVGHSPPLLRLGFDGSLSHSFNRTSSTTSPVSARSARSGRLSSRTATLRRESRGPSPSHLRRPRDSPGRQRSVRVALLIWAASGVLLACRWFCFRLTCVGGFAQSQPCTPQSVSLGGRSNSDSNNSTHRELVTHQSVPSHLNKLSDEATLEFSKFLRETHSWSHPKRKKTKGRSSGRTPGRSSGRHSHRSGNNNTDLSRSWRSNDADGRSRRASRQHSTTPGRRHNSGKFSFLVQTQQAAQQAAQAAQAAAEKRQRETEAAIAAAAVAAEQQRHMQERRAVAASLQMNMALVAPAPQFGVPSPMGVAQSPYGTMFGMPSPIAMPGVPAPRVWPAPSYVNAMASPAVTARPGAAAFATAVRETQRRARPRATHQLAADHAAFGSGSFPLPPSGPSTSTRVPLPSGPPPRLAPGW